MSKNQRSKSYLNQSAGSGIRRKQHPLTGDGTAQAITHDVTGHVTCSVRVTGPDGTSISYAVRDCVDKDDYGTETQTGTLTLSEEESGSGEYRDDFSVLAFSRTHQRFLLTVPDTVDVTVTVVSH